MNKQEQDLPWLNRPSIYSHISENVDAITGRLDPRAYHLPDEERRNATTRLRWAPGALDGAFGHLEHHVEANKAEEMARNVALHIAEIARRNSQDHQLALYNLLLEDQLVEFIDIALEQIIHNLISAYPHLHDFAGFLATQTPDRGPVKFGIALLGVIGNQDDQEVILRLGLHDEFTLFSAVAISNLLPDPEPVLWELAKKVDGWGKIHLVERLTNTDSPQIMEWLLRDGYRNTIMYEYLAYDCAKGGNLKSALMTGTIDDQLFGCAGEIIEALIMGGPAEDINDYEDAAEVITRYLIHLQDRPLRLEFFGVVDSIFQYLADECWDTRERHKNGWNEDLRSSAVQQTGEILADPVWLPIIEQGLASSDDREFYRAAGAADTLGIETWKTHWARLQNNPMKDHSWYAIMSRTNLANIQLVVNYAMRVLPLDQLATGAADELGIGPEYELHSCLDFILQELGRFPSVGWPLVAAGLKSPVVRSRNLALKCLEKWGRANWNREVEEALVAAKIAEPREDVKMRIEKVLDGRPID